MIKKYRKKPVVIEAIQFTGNNFMEIKEWMKASGSERKPEPVEDSEFGEIVGIKIPTLEGDMIANAEINGASESNSDEAYYLGFFTCPVCNSENAINDWKIKKDGNVVIKFSEKTYKSITVVCGGCGAKWVMGLRENSEKESVDNEKSGG